MKTIKVLISASEEMHDEKIQFASLIENLNEALDITADDINEFLGGLPPNKYHCSILGQDALKDAIKNYQEREVKDEK